MLTTFTISELEARTGLRRRTIHFYVQQGFLPAPSGAGGSARYGEEHLLRLILIKEMQSSHLKLSGIKEALDAMSIEQMRALAGKISGANVTWDPQSLERWITHSHQDRDAAGYEEPPVICEERRAPFDEKEEPEGFSFLDALDKARSGKKIQGSGPRRTAASGSRGRPSLGEAAQWERIIIADGIELHVRSDRYGRIGDRIARLIDFCRKIF
jgi:DNA-binding transcriptional MerR regulator